MSTCWERLLLAGSPETKVWPPGFPACRPRTDGRSVGAPLPSNFFGASVRLPSLRSASQASSWPPKMVRRSIVSVGDTPVDKRVRSEGISGILRASSKQLPGRSAMSSTTKRPTTDNTAGKSGNDIIFKLNGSGSGKNPGQSEKNENAMEDSQVEDLSIVSSVDLGLAALRSLLDDAKVEEQPPVTFSRLRRNERKDNDRRGLHRGGYINILCKPLSR